VVCNLVWLSKTISHVRACTHSHSSARSVPSWPAVREIPDPLMMYFFCGGHLNPFPSVITTPIPAMMALSFKTTLREFRRSISPLCISCPFLSSFFCLSRSLAAHFPMQRDACSVWRLFFPELRVKLEHSSALCVARGSLRSRYTLDSEKQSTQSCLNSITVYQLSQSFKLFINGLQLLSARIIIWLKPSSDPDWFQFRSAL